MTRKFMSAALLAFCVLTLNAQTDTLRQAIKQFTQTKKADIGVSIYGLEDKDSVGTHQEKHFPMQSVFKFHIALAILHGVDNGKFQLAQKIWVSKKDLVPDTWSPLRDAHLNGDLYLTLEDILAYTVSQSDNIGCDILLRLIGGPKKVDQYLHQIGIKDVAIKASEAEMHKNWNVQFTNWTTPTAANELLLMFYQRNILSKTMKPFLWKLMTETTTGKNKIKGQLPENTLVAHKTGSSGANKDGLTAASNDIGIVTLPNGKHFAISVFVSNSMEDEDTNAAIIATISKLAWDYYVAKIN